MTLQMQRKGSLLCKQLLSLPYRANENSRLLISQDDDQVWLTFAEYDKEYEDYIRNIPPMRRKKSKKRSFLTMCEHGPWDIDNPEMMRQLGSLILALVYQHSGVDLDKLKADIVSRMKSGVKR